jgi:hypothetical protein
MNESQCSDPMMCILDKSFDRYIEHPSTPSEHTYMVQRAERYHNEQAMLEMLIDSGECTEERFPNVTFDSDEFLLDDVNVIRCLHDHRLYHVYYSVADHVSFDMRMAFTINGELQ